MNTYQTQINDFPAIIAQAVIFNFKKELKLENKHQFPAGVYKL